MIITAAVQGAEMSKYSEFWNWFRDHDAVFHDFNTVDESVEKEFDEMNVALNKVNPDLVFEFGPKGAVREMVISAGGIKSAFPDVAALVDAAPNLDKWKFVKFRPRRDPVNIVHFKSVVIDPKDVRYTLFKDGDKIGLALYHSKYTKENAKEWGSGLYLLLDEVLGEHDVEMKVGFIEFATPKDEKMGKYFNDENTVEHLPAHFDDMWGRIGGI